MVLAEFVKFKRGLYRSCGVEWLEGTMVEPCLLQHVFTWPGLAHHRRREEVVAHLSLGLSMMYYNNMI